MSSQVRSVSVNDSSFNEIIREQRQKGNLMRANLERYKSKMPPPLPEENEDDDMTTRSVISTISNQGKIETVNQYKLIKLLGQGSFAKVFLAKDSNLG
jgi:serine/threonine protein kinase